MKANTFTCPHCDSPRIRVSRKKRRGITAVLLCLHTFRCDSCQRQFRGRTIQWRYVWYAKCPRCAGLELTNWEEKYYYPPWYKRALTHVGAREQRCDSCRYNFISFRPRWRAKESGSK